MSLVGPRISPFLWFNSRAEEAARHYVALFPNSSIDAVARYPEGTPGVADSVMTVEFGLDGTRFTALNGGPHYCFTPAVSFVIQCAGQAEVDHYWDGLLAGGGVPSQCGWLVDRFGLSWQVIPSLLPSLLQDVDPAKAQRTAAAMMSMVKLDIEKLQRAYRG